MCLNNTTPKNKQRGASGEVSQIKSSGGKVVANNTTDETLKLVEQQIRKLEKDLRIQITKNINDLGGISASERKKIVDYSMALLHPSGPVDIPRPIPCKSHKAYHRGMYVLETEDDSLAVEVSPDPFDFARITSSSALSAHVAEPLPIINFDNLNTVAQLEEVDAGSQNTLFFYPTAIPLEGGKLLQPALFQSEESSASANFITIWDGGIEYNVVPAFSDVDIAVGFANVDVLNTGMSFIEGGVFIARVMDDGQFTIMDETLGHNFSSGSPVNINLSIPSPLNFLGTRHFVLGLKVTNASAPYLINDLSFRFNALPATATAGSKVVTSLTLGKAIYQGDPTRAEQLDELFRTSALWAPVACSTIVNCVQVLKERGGEFLSAYLPSNVGLSVPNDPASAWSQLVGYGRSYPVATNSFQHGAHATWVGARIQDYEFRRPFTDPKWLGLQKTALPMTVILAQRAKSDTSSSIRYYIEFRVAFAVQTLNPVISMTLSPSCPSFCVLFLSIVAAHSLLVGENPDHMKRLIELAKKVATDPRVVALAKTGLAKAIPLLMSALA